MQIPPFHTLAHPCDFYLVRHGESESNAGGRIQGHTDSPLSDVGREHARAAGRWFMNRGVELILSSPLSRAYQTAEAIARSTGAPRPERVDELMELDTGVYSGRRLAELSEMDPALFARFRIHSWEAVPDAERMDSLGRRASAVWSRLIEESRRGNRVMVCVSHGGMIQWLIKATIGCEGQRWMPLVETSNCGIFHFHAESTTGGETPADHVQGTGYYGVWRQMNLVPY